MRGCVDGCIVEASVNGLSFLALVKGYEHPINAFFIVPYKINNIKLSLIKANCIGRNTFILYKNNIKIYYNPQKILRMRWKELPREARDLLALLEPDWAGLTGSWAVFKETRESDVDLLLYFNEKNKIIDILKNIIKKTINFNKKCLKRIIAKRSGRSDIGIDLNIIKNSLTEICFQDKLFTLRILRRIEPLPCDIMEQRRVWLGRGEYRGFMRPLGDVDSLLVPAYYILDNKIIVETWRTRYQGLPEGVYCVRGDVFEEKNGVQVISPDLWGGVWKCGEA